MADNLKLKVNNSADVDYVAIYIVSDDAKITEKSVQR